MTVATKTARRTRSRTSVLPDQVIFLTGTAYASSCSDPTGQIVPQNVLPIDKCNGDDGADDNDTRCQGGIRR